MLIEFVCYLTWYKSNDADIYDDLISRRVNSSDAEKFAEVCPCPCNGVAWGVIWWDFNSLKDCENVTVRILAIDVLRSSMLSYVSHTSFYGPYLQGNDIFHISLWCNVPWTCHLVMRYYLFLWTFSLVYLDASTILHRILLGKGNSIFSLISVPFQFFKESS